MNEESLGTPGNGPHIACPVLRVPVSLCRETSVAALRANVLRVASAAYGPACYPELELVLTTDPLAIEIVRQAESASGMRAAEVAQVHWGSEAKRFIGSEPSTVFEAAEVEAADAAAEGAGLAGVGPAGAAAGDAVTFREGECDLSAQSTEEGLPAALV